MSGPITSPFGPRWGDVPRRHRHRRQHGHADPRGGRRHHHLLRADRRATATSSSIDHGNGMVTLYGHQNQLIATQGQRVSAGQVIGFVGQHRALDRAPPPLRGAHQRRRGRPVGVPPLSVAVTGSCRPHRPRTCLRIWVGQLIQCPADEPVGSTAGRIVRRLPIRRRWFRRLRGPQALRRGHHRRWSGWLRRRALRRGGRARHRHDREDQGRRHLPARRVHPGQGAARDGGGAPDSRRRRRASASRSVRRSSTSRSPRCASRRSSTSSSTGLTGLLKAAQGHRSSTASARWARPRRARSPAASRATSSSTATHVILASGSVPRTIPGFEVDGKLVVTSDELLSITSCRPRRS